MFCFSTGLEGLEVWRNQEAPTEHIFKLEVSGAAAEFWHRIARRLQMRDGVLGVRQAFQEVEISEIRQLEKDLGLECLHELSY